ncbi:MAG: histidine phosphatase family protein [Dehalococcoidia bacterium]
MHLILVRHGETPENLQGEIQGQRETQLSDTGKQQALEIGEYLRDQPLYAAFTSDLQRAMDTTKQILSYHPGIESYFRPQLRERSLGVFEGRMVPEFEQSVTEQPLPYYEYRPPGGESLLDVEARVESLWRSIWEQFNDKTILISAHNGANLALLKILLKYTFEEAKSLRQDNACINIIDLGPDGSIVSKSLNYTSHLSAKTDNRMGGLSR